MAFAVPVRGGEDRKVLDDDERGDSWCMGAKSVWDWISNLVGQKQNMAGPRISKFGQEFGSLTMSPITTDTYRENPTETLGEPYNDAVS